MNISDNQLDQLFSQARKEQPVATLDDTRKAFITATVVAAGGVLATNSLLKLLTLKKWIIMISTLSIITTAAIIASTSSNPKEEPSQSDHSALLTTIDNPLNDSVEEVSLKLVEHNIVESSPLIIEDEDLLMDELNHSEITSETSGLTDSIKPFLIKADASVNPSVLNQTQEKIKAFDQRFTLTHNTSPEDLEAMKKEAGEDGVDFKYKASFHKSRLTKIDLTLKIDSKDGNESQCVVNSIKIKGDFSYTVAWYNGDDGQATRIYCGHTEEFDEDIQGLNEEIEELQELTNELEWDDLSLSLDSLALQMAMQFENNWEDFDIQTEQNWESLEEELAELKEDFEVAVQNINREEINSLANEISESSAELVRAVQDELKKIQIELEKKEEERRVAEKDKKKEKEKLDQED